MNLKKWLPNAITLLLAALLVITQQAWASPLVERLTATTTSSSKTTINYQGYLTDASGNPVDDTLDMVFRLYNVESGGAALWAENQNGVAVADGLFSVLLGSVTPISADIVAGNDDLWLGISVGADEEMLPREKLASAPSAMSVPDGSVTTEKIADGAVTAPKLSLPDGLTIRQGASEYKTIIEGRQISMQDGPSFPGRSHLNTFWNNLYVYTDQGSVTIGGENGEAEDLKVNGDLTVGGSKSAVVSTPHYGQRALYAYEQASNRFGDEGQAVLIDGVARVELDPVFLETVERDFLIHVTPYGDASLYVAEVGEDYFAVKAQEGDPNVTFAWRLSATRKGYAGVRLEEVEEVRSQKAIEQE